MKYYASMKKCDLIKHNRSGTTMDAPSMAFLKVWIRLERFLADNELTFIELAYASSRNEKKKVLH
jgi:hypothetical protein